MIFWSTTMWMKLNANNMIGILEKYFSDDYGVSEVIDDIEGNVVLISIDKVKRNDDGCVLWTHYANIQKIADGWEVNEQFIIIDDEFCKKWGDEYRKWIGSEQTAMNIYARVNWFVGAVRNLASFGTSKEGRKPIDVYV